MSKTGQVIYIMDTLCGWCNIARPEIHNLFDAIYGEVPFTILHRRLFTAPFIPTVDDAFLQMIRKVGWEHGPALTGQVFSESYMELVQNSSFRHDSHLTSLAYTAAFELLAEAGRFQFAEQLQSLIFDEGLDPNDLQTLIRAVDDSQLDRGTFLNLVEQAETLQTAEETAATAQQLQGLVGASGVPVLLFQTDDKLIRLDPYRSHESHNAILNETQQITTH